MAGKISPPQPPDNSVESLRIAFQQMAASVEKHVTSAGQTIVKQVAGGAAGGSGGAAAAVAAPVVTTGGLSSRATATITTALLAPGATETDLATLATSAAILGIATDYPAWVRLYTTDAARTADAGRAYTDFPTAGSGIVLDTAPAAGALTVWEDPVPIFTNNDGVPAATAYVSIQNMDSVSRAINLTITYLPLEA